MQSQESSNAEQGAIHSPWSEVMKAPAGHSCKVFLTTPDAVLSNSSDVESGTSRSRSPSGCQPVSCEFPRSSAPPQPPEMRQLSTKGEDSLDAAQAVVVDSWTGADCSSEGGSSNDEEKRGRECASRVRPFRGSSTADTEPRSPTALLNDGAAPGHAIGETGSIKRFAVKQNRVVPSLDVASTRVEDSKLSGGPKVYAYSGGRPSDSWQPGASATKPSKSWEHDAGWRREKKFLDPKELLTSDSGEEATLDTAASDSLLLESLVGILSPSQSVDGARNRPHGARCCCSRCSPSRSHGSPNGSPPGGSSFRWSPTSRTSTRESSQRTAIPKPRREFSGDGYLEATAAEGEGSPSGPRSRRRSARNSFRRASRRSTEAESQNSDWFLLPDDLEKAMMSASVDPISEDLLSQSIFSLFTGNVANQ